MFSVFCLDNNKCQCGKEHVMPTSKVICGNNVLEKIIDVINEYNCKKIFVLSDKNTFYLLSCFG